MPITMEIEQGGDGARLVLFLVKPPDFVAFLMESSTRREKPPLPPGPREAPGEGGFPGQGWWKNRGQKVPTGQKFPPKPHWLPPPQSPQLVPPNHCFQQIHQFQRFQRSTAILQFSCIPRVLHCQSRYSLGYSFCNHFDTSLDSHLELSNSGVGIGASWGRSPLACPLGLSLGTMVQPHSNSYSFLNWDHLDAGHGA